MPTVPNRQKQERLRAESVAARIGLRQVGLAFLKAAFKSTAEAVLSAAKREQNLTIHYFADFEKKLEEYRLARARFKAAPGAMPTERIVIERPPAFQRALRFGAGLLIAGARATGEAVLRASQREQSITIGYVSSFLRRSGFTWAKLMPPRGRQSRTQDVARFFVAFLGAAASSTLKATLMAAQRRQYYALPEAWETFKKIYGRDPFAPRPLPRIPPAYLTRSERIAMLRKAKEVERTNYAIAFFGAAMRSAVDAFFLSAMRQQGLTYQHFFNLRNRVATLNRATGAAYYLNRIYGAPNSLARRAYEAMHISPAAYFARSFAKIAARTTIDAVFNAAMRNQTVLVGHWASLIKNQQRFNRVHRAVHALQEAAAQVGHPPLTPHQIARYISLAERRIKVRG